MKPQKVRQEESQDEYVAPLATLPKVKVSLTHAAALLPSADLACSGAFCVLLGNGLRGRLAAREWPAAAIQLLGHHEWTKWLGQSAGGALQTCLPDAALVDDPC
jgi:hypothetical protein